MASERTINEYDSTRIANAVDTLAENLSGYTGSTVTPTTAMKGKLPSQTVGDRIADALEDLATNVTASGHEILDATGTELTQRNQLQFKGLDVTDDSANGRTVVDGYNVKERIGKAGKNLIPFPYDTSGSDEQGITYSVGSVGQVTISGSTGSSIWSYCYLQRSFRLKAGTYRFSADATLTGDIELVLDDTSNNRIAVLYTANPTEFTLAQDTDLRLYIWINQSTTISTPLTIYPMIYDSVAFTDPTFEPYHPTVEKLDEVKASYKHLGEVGAKNMLPYPYYNTTQVFEGVTYTDNGDGSITLSASSDTRNYSYFRLTSTVLNERLVLKPGSYIISSGTNNLPSGLGIIVESETQRVADSEAAPSFTYTSTQRTNIYISVLANVDLTTPITLYPMLRLAEDTDPTWQPYAMTNRELTVKNIFTSFTANAAFHNSLYRGKSLGTEVTQDQWDAISAGTFDDMYIGDYWTINSRVYRIAAFDYWLHHGDTECTTHHIVLVPDANLYTAKMNDSNVTTGGYVGSKMYTENLAAAKTTIKGDFNAAHILSHREYLTNAITSGYAGAGSWYDSDIELMNEVMVYGTDFFTPHNSLGATIPNTYTVDTSQLPLFALEHSRICNRAYWWLRDVVSATFFALVGSDGYCVYTNAPNAFGVRPAFGIKA